MPKLKVIVNGAIGKMGQETVKAVSKEQDLELVGVCDIKLPNVPIKELVKEVKTIEDIGEYLFLRRVVTERADIANPLGHNRKTAEKQLEYLRQTLGDAKFAELEKAVERFQQISKNLLTEAEKAGVIKPDVYEKTAPKCPKKGG